MEKNTGDKREENKRHVGMEGGGKEVGNVDTEERKAR